MQVKAVRDQGKEYSPNKTIMEVYKDVTVFTKKSLKLQYMENYADHPYTPEALFEPLLPTMGRFYMLTQSLGFAVDAQNKILYFSK